MWPSLAGLPPRALVASQKSRQMVVLRLGDDPWIVEQLLHGDGGGRDVAGIRADRPGGNIAIRIGDPNLRSQPGRRSADNWRQAVSCRRASTAAGRSESRLPHDARQSGCRSRPGPIEQFAGTHPMPSARGRLAGPRRLLCPSATAPATRKRTPRYAGRLASRAAASRRTARTRPRSGPRWSPWSPSRGRQRVAPLVRRLRTLVPTA